MRKNIGKWDRIIRALIGLALLVAAIYYWSIWLFLGAIFTFFEAVMSWCVFYALIGRSSCKLPPKKRK